MKYFLDTEFIEDGKTIDLISIGIVAEDGREYYAISTEFNPQKASSWVKKNVINSLPSRYSFPEDSPRQRAESKAWKNRETIAIEVMAFLKGQPLTDLKYCARSGFEQSADKLFGMSGFLDHPNSTVKDIFNDVNFSDDPLEIWGEWCSYDWVVFCQLFGTMMDLPRGFPMRCRDIIQYCEDDLNINSSKLPKSLETDGNHNALLGAKTVKIRFDWLKTQENLRRNPRPI